MYTIINELSFTGQANSPHTANALIKALLRIIQVLEEFRGKDPICTHSDLFNSKLLPDCNLSCWIGTTDRDIREAFLRYTTKGPKIDILLNEKVGNHHKYYFNQKDVVIGQII